METNSKLLVWLPRVLCILAILFISMFALDAFDPQNPFGQQILDFLMHMIPSFILILLLAIAWKRELTGGIIFGLLGLSTAPFIYTLNYHRSHSVALSLGIVCMVCLPFFVVGILFILNYYRTKGGTKVS